MAAPGVSNDSHPDSGRRALSSLSARLDPAVGVHLATSDRRSFREATVPEAGLLEFEDHARIRRGQPLILFVVVQPIE